MRDRWSEAGAAEAIDRWGIHGERLALRVYSSRLIGAEVDLVLHGGGNTSVKDAVQDVLGDTVPALFVKGSGWDLATIEPQGFAPVDLGYLVRMRALAALSDEDMVAAQRTHLLRAGAPDPSIETLLHAFLPHRYVDHSHADAILGLTNRADGAEHAREALGDRVAIVPYVKAGFDLAKVAAEVHDAHPACEGLVLLHHGLFTFGETAEASYRKHVELVDRAERYLARRARSVSVAVTAPELARRRAAAVMPALRGALAAVDPAHRRWVLGFRPSPHADDPDLEALAAAGPLTPDHVIRTKPKPLVVEPDPDAALAAVRRYAEAYEGYFARCAAGEAHRYVRLDPLPRVIWVRGAGVVTVGASAREAAIAADIAEHTLGLVARAAGLGPVEPLPDERLFEMEYWSLEQKKLGKGSEPPLARRVALVTGGAGAIGVGVARQLLAAGAHVVLTDVDDDALARAARELAAGGRLATAWLDVTDPASVAAGFAEATLAFGGVDLVVVNAGIAVGGAIAELDDAAVARATEINFHGALRTLREAARRFAVERTGGDVVVVSTKNVAAPGAAFGAYSATKAAAHQLAKVAALELAPLGVRVNLVAPDAVFAEGAIRSGLWDTVGADRARARGIDPATLPAYYRERNLLKAEVTGSHVGHAVVFLASGLVPTTGAVLPVDGGLPEAFPR